MFRSERFAFRRAHGPVAFLVGAILLAAGGSASAGGLSSSGYVPPPPCSISHGPAAPPQPCPPPSLPVGAFGGNEPLHPNDPPRAFQ